MSGRAATKKRIDPNKPRTGVVAQAGLPRRAHHAAVAQIEPIETARDVLEDLGNG